MADLDPVETLIEMEAIRQLKARYFRCLDTKDWEGFAQVWEEEIEHEMTTEGMKHSGSRDLFVKFVSGALHGAVTVHRGHNPELEITSPTTAKAIWPFVDRLKPGPEAHGRGPRSC